MLQAVGDDNYEALKKVGEVLHKKEFGSTSDYNDLVNQKNNTGKHGKKRKLEVKVEIEENQQNNQEGPAQMHQNNQDFTNSFQNDQNNPNWTVPQMQ